MHIIFSYPGATAVHTDEWISILTVWGLVNLPVMAAIAVRKKAISIGHFSLCFRFQSLQFFFFVRLNQEQLYVLNAPKIREK